MKLTAQQLRRIILEQANALNEDNSPQDIVQSAHQKLEKIARDLGASSTFVRDVEAAITHATSTPDNLGGPEALQKMVAALASLPTQLPVGNMEILEQTGTLSEDTEAPGNVVSLVLTAAGGGPGYLGRGSMIQGGHDAINAMHRWLEEEGLLDPATVEKASTETHERILAAAAQARQVADPRSRRSAIVVY